MAGDRVSGGLAPGVQAVGAALYLLAPSTPMVFMGEEWAASTPWQFFTSFEDDWLAEAVREGRRSEFAAHGWSRTRCPTRRTRRPATRSVLDWAERAPAHARMLRWYSGCTRLRRELLGSAPTRLADVTVDRRRGRPLGRHGAPPWRAARHTPSSSTWPTTGRRCRSARREPRCSSPGTTWAPSRAAARCGCLPRPSRCSAWADALARHDPGTSRERLPGGADPLTRVARSVGRAGASGGQRGRGDPAAAAPAHPPGRPRGRGDVRADVDGRGRHPAAALVGHRRRQRTHHPRRPRRAALGGPHRRRATW